MSCERRRRSKPRRDFMIRTALLGAAALLGKHGRRPARAVGPAPEHKRTDGRYRLTEHIRRYYERASF